MPPLGLATIAAMLSTDRFEVLPIVDLNIERLTDAMISRADVVMISAMIVQQDSLREVIARVKRFEKIVVVGGPYATSYREEVLAMGADHLVLDEAELTLAPFVEDFLAGRAERVYDQQSVSSRVSIPVTREGKPLITATPIPRWDLLKLRVYSSLAIQFSRGCPFNCEFCNITSLFGRLPRTKTAAQMIAELDAILATGWRGTIFIVDDNFIGNRVQVLEFLKLLIEWQKKHHYPFSFYTEASLDLANDNMRDVLLMMSKAGFTEVFCGIESTNPEVLASMHKHQNKGDLNQKVRTIQRIGKLDVTAGFIVGSDDDVPTVCRDLFEFIQKNGIVFPMVGLLMVLRDTLLFHRLQGEGRLRGEATGNNTHTLKLNFAPMRNGESLDEKLLIEDYVNLLEELFTPKNYFARCRTQRRNRGRVSRSVHVNGSWPKAMLEIFYRNLIKRLSWEFIKFMFDTLLTSPTDFPEAVTQAIKFESPRKIYAAVVSAHRYPQMVEALFERVQDRVRELRGGVERRLKKLAATRDKYLAKATKWYHALDPHFRAGAEKAYKEFCARLQAYIDTHRKECAGPTSCS